MYWPSLAVSLNRLPVPALGKWNLSRVNSPVHFCIVCTTPISLIRLDDDTQCKKVFCCQVVSVCFQSSREQFICFASISVLTSVNSVIAAYGFQLLVFFMCPSKNVFLHIQTQEINSDDKLTMFWCPYTYIVNRQMYFTNWDVVLLMRGLTIQHS